MLMMRGLLFSLLLLTAGIVNAAGPAALESLGDGAWLFRHGEQRSLFLVSSAGVIVTDPLNAEAARTYREAIRSLTDQPVRYVVYSHYHWDRVSGAEVFRREGAEIVAQQRCAERFAMNPNSAVVPPDRTFERQLTLRVGGRSLDLHYFGPVHGDCLTVFVAQPAGVAQIVDVVNPPAAAFPDNPLASYIRPHNLDTFFSATENMLRRDGITRIAAYRADPDPLQPGGVSVPTGPAQLVAEQAAFWTMIEATVERAIAERRVGIDSMVKLRKEEITAFEAYAGFDPDSLPLILRRFSGYTDMGR